MKRYLYIGRNAQGSMMAEAAISITFLVLAFIGILTVSDQIEENEVVIRMAHQIAQVLSTSPVDDPAERETLYAIIALAGTANNINNSISFSVKFCKNGVEQPSYGYTSLTMGVCGPGVDQNSSGTVADATCANSPSGPPTGHAKAVSVQVACYYYPRILGRGLFNDTIMAETEIPLEPTFLLP